MGCWNNGILEYWVWRNDIYFYFYGAINIAILLSYKEGLLLGVIKRAKGERGAFGRWRLEVGGEKGAFGRWRLEVGGESAKDE